MAILLRFALLITVLFHLGVLDALAQGNHWVFYYEAPCCGNSHHVRHHKGEFGLELGVFFPRGLESVPYLSSAHLHRWHPASHAAPRSISIVYIGPRAASAATQNVPSRFQIPCSQRQTNVSHVCRRITTQNIYLISIDVLEYWKFPFFHTRPVSLVKH